MTVPLSDKKRQIYRKQLMDKGRAIAGKLSKVMSGQNQDLSGIALRTEKPGMTKAEKLRAYLDFINARRQALDDNDGTFGTCHHCGTDLREVELDQVPWADDCGRCQGQD